MQQTFIPLQSASELEVRKAKVAQIKMEVANGTYKVVGSEVAAAILRESLENDLAALSCSFLKVATTPAN